MSDDREQSPAGGVDREQKTCGFEGCNRPFYAKGLCGPHRQQQLRGKDLTPIRIYHEPTGCQADLNGDPCPKRALYFGGPMPLCNTHYRAWRTYGSPTGSIKANVIRRGMAAIAEALAVRDRSGCWTDWATLPVWGGHDKFGGAHVNGYPMLGRVPVAHLVLTQAGHVRPDNAVVVRTCATGRACWNPDHLRWATRQKAAQMRKGTCEHCPHCRAKKSM